MYEKAIAEVKKHIVEEILNKSELRKTWRSTWLRLQNADIQKEVENKIRAEREQIKEQLKEVESQLRDVTEKLETNKQFSPNSVSYHSNESYEKRRLEQRRSELRNKEPSRDVIHKRIRAEFKQKFLTTVWNKSQPMLQSLLQKQIDQFKPDQIIEQFLTRHPWIRAEVNRNGDVMPDGLLLFFTRNIIRLHDKVFSLT